MSRGQEELLLWACEGKLIIFLGVEGGKEKRGFQKSFFFSKEFLYAKEDLQDIGSLVIIKLRLFSPLVKN